MGVECDYSFEMLYKAAFGKNISKEEKLELQVLDQDDINIQVKKWAKKAKWKIDTKLGSDKRVYVSFHP